MTFRAYWRERPLLGHPILPQRSEGGYNVQYFTNARVEYHPEVSNERYVMQAGNLGEALIQFDARARSMMGREAGSGRCYDNTFGHLMPDPICDFYIQHGGVDVFGVPITK